MFQQYFGNETDTQTVAATVTLKKLMLKVIETQWLQQRFFKINKNQEVHRPNHSPEEKFFLSLSRLINMKHILNIVKLIQILICSRIWQYIKTIIDTKKSNLLTFSYSSYI